MKNYFNVKYDYMYNCIKISDNESPRFDNCPAGSYRRNTESGQDTAVARWPFIVATDNSGEEPYMICNPREGTRFAIGKTDVNCSAEDKSGNVASCNFPVRITGKKKYILFSIN